MKVLFSLAMIGLLAGCSIKGRSVIRVSTSPQIERLRTNQVWVRIECDVLKPGLAQIPRGLSSDQELIRRAGGGWFRFGGVPIRPKRWTVERVCGGITNRWEIWVKDFKDEQRSDYWRNFLLYDGDTIRVRAVF